MTLLAFPLFDQVTATIGRRLRLQGSFGSSNSANAPKPTGPQHDIRHSAARIVRSLVDWGALDGAGEVGVYRADRHITPAEPAHALWLLEALLLSRGADLPLNDLLRAAELFPFNISLTAHDLMQSNRLQVYQQGQEMTMVHRVPQQESMGDLSARQAGLS